MRPQRLLYDGYGLLEIRPWMRGAGAAACFGREGHHAPGEQIAHRSAPAGLPLSTPSISPWSETPPPWGRRFACTHCPFGATLSAHRSADPAHTGRRSADGLPPKVELMRAGGCRLSFSPSRHAPIGNPPAKPFGGGDHIRQNAEMLVTVHLPVRPLPVCTSIDHEQNVTRLRQFPCGLDVFSVRQHTPPSPCGF